MLLRRVGPLAVLAALLIVAFGWGALSARAAATHVGYECVPKDPDAEAPPPIPQIALERGDVPESQPQLCTGDAVPVSTEPMNSAEALPALSPKEMNKHKGRFFYRRPAARTHRRHHAKAARQEHSGVWYSYATAEQWPPKHIIEYYVELTPLQPYVAAAGSHSLGQLWAGDIPEKKAYSTVETGYTEAPGQYPDVETHLFLAMSDEGIYPEGGYVGNKTIPWVQVSTTHYPNEIIPHEGTPHGFAVENRSGNWWFYYYGTWLGYIPHSGWKKQFPVINNVEAGGEVETPEYTTCTDMGDGLAGTELGSGALAYSWWLNSEYGEAANYTKATMTDIAQYNAGLWAPEPGKHVDAFHFGGPGWC